MEDLNELIKELDTTKVEYEKSNHKNKKKIIQEIEALTNTCEANKKEIKSLMDKLPKEYILNIYVKKYREKLFQMLENYNKEIIYYTEEGLEYVEKSNPKQTLNNNTKPQPPIPYAVYLKRKT